ncbi:MAG: EI24 domain-containing protein [Bacteroidota bacterium]
MKFFSQLRTGITSYVDAIKFISDNRLWHFFIPPLVLSGLILWGGYELEKSLDIGHEIGEVSTISELMSEMVRYFLLHSVVVLAYEFRKYLVFTLLSPVLTSLSLRTEKIITGNTYTFTRQQYWSDIRRAIRIATGNLVVQYFILALWFILSTLIPSLKPATTVFIFIVYSYFYGFCLIDYVNERRRLNIEQSVKFVRQNAGLSMGLGLIFSGMFFVPWDIGVIFAPVLGIVAGCIAMHKVVDLNTTVYAAKEKE